MNKRTDERTDECGRQTARKHNAFVRIVGWQMHNKKISCINVVLLREVGKFCYLGDVLDSDAGCNSAVMVTVKCMGKLCEYLPKLTGKL